MLPAEPDLTTGATQTLLLAQSWAYPAAPPDSEPAAAQCSVCHTCSTRRDSFLPTSGNEVAQNNLLASAVPLPAKMSSVLPRTGTQGEQGWSGAAAGTQVAEEPWRQEYTQGSSPGFGLAGKAFLPSKRNAKGNQSKAAPQGKKRQNPRVTVATHSEHSVVLQCLAWLSRVLITGSWTGTCTAKPEPHPLRKQPETRLQHGPGSILEPAVPVEGMKNRAWV